MPLPKPKDFGAGIGPSRPAKEPDPIEFALSRTGLRLDVGPEELKDGESLDLQSITAEFGYIGPTYDLTALGTAVVSTDSQKVLAIVSYDKQNELKFVVRMRPTRWDYWDGATWTQLAGTVAGRINYRWQSCIMQDVLVGANGVGQLVQWDGGATSPVQILSPDAPIAQFITRIGNRILAAKIRPSLGANFDPYLLAYCADGNITDWTTVNFGAGAGELAPAGSSESAQFFTGLSCLERGAVIYRQRSIVLASLTGVGLAPFRFQHVDFAHGTESPYSIANGGVSVGDFFLGEDYIVYNFDGIQAPVPIGIPILSELRSVVVDRSTAVGVIDTQQQRYYLYVATDATNPANLNMKYSFDIKKYKTLNRLEWLREPIDGFTAVGFGKQVPFANDPIINTVPAIVNTVPNIVNSYLNPPIKDVVLVGTSDGKTYYVDRTVIKVGGYITLRPVSLPDDEVTIDWIRLTYQADAIATVGVSVSFDGGRTFSDEKVMGLQPTGPGQYSAKEWIYQTGHWPFIRIRFLSGQPRLFKTTAGVRPRGRSVN